MQVTCSGKPPPWVVVSNATPNPQPRPRGAAEVPAGAVAASQPLDASIAHQHEASPHPQTPPCSRWGPRSSPSWCWPAGRGGGLPWLCGSTVGCGSTVRCPMAAGGHTDFKVGGSACWRWARGEQALLPALPAQQVQPTVQPHHPLAQGAVPLGSHCPPAATPPTHPPTHPGEGKPTRASAPRAAAVLLRQPPSRHKTTPI